METKPAPIMETERLASIARPRPTVPPPQRILKALLPALFRKANRASHYRNIRGQKSVFRDIPQRA
jgi:hypothetical protein